MPGMPPERAWILPGYDGAIEAKTDPLLTVLAAPGLLIVATAPRCPWTPVNSARGATKERVVVIETARTSRGAVVGLSV